MEIKTVPGEELAYWEDVQKQGDFEVKPLEENFELDKRSEIEKLKQAQKIWEEVQEQGDFEVAPLEENFELDKKSEIEKLKLTEAQKMQVSEMVSHIPMVAASGVTANAYSLRFPEGVPHTRTKLLGAYKLVEHEGGYTTTIRGEKGRFAGSATIHPLTSQAIVLGAFTAMSVATGQYFLASINKELHTINKKLDEILEFLYGEKKAELLAEVKFVKQAQINYSSVMSHEAQRIAMIVGLQEAQKVAIKDIEFYMKCLDEKTDILRKEKSWKENIAELTKIRENLELSMQLYLISCLMEIYYSQNFDDVYIDNVQDEVGSYLKNGYEQLIEKTTEARTTIKNMKTSAREQEDKEKVWSELSEKMEEWKQERDSVIPKIYGILNTTNKCAQYYINENGDVYYQHNAK